MQDAQAQTVAAQTVIGDTVIAGTVIARRQGRIGRIVLNRPRALNALDLGMLSGVAAALEEWRCDPAVDAVVIEGAGGRAFCAGGDIRTIRELALAQDGRAIDAFFAAEYGLNLTIAEYPKPYVALIDGICMGGGLGVSIHGRARIATENAMFAMPETAIGLFPDIGASFFLPRMRGAFGMYMALTGARIVGADAVYLGLSTHYVSRARLATLADEIAADGMAVLGTAVERTEGGVLPGLAAKVQRCFSAGSVAEMVQGLEAEGDDWAAKTLAALRALSPRSVLWTFEMMRRGRDRTLRQCLAAETTLMRHATRQADFPEGVRAMVVDKDRRPLWSVARIEDVPPADITAVVP